MALWHMRNSKTPPNFVPKTSQRNPKKGLPSKRTSRGNCFFVFPAVVAAVAVAVAAVAAAVVAAAAAVGVVVVGTNKDWGP